jgi:hypothetical protein
MTVSLMEVSLLKFEQASGMRTPPGRAGCTSRLL